MKIIDLKQRSEEWLRWRKSGVSASEASVVLGVNPYKTPWRLWAEKSGRAVEADLRSNPHVRRGIALEDRARQVAESVLGEDFLLPVCGENEAKPHLRASFDGLTSANVPVELKCPSDKQWAAIAAYGEAAEAFALYRPQVIHQMVVADADHGWLFFYSPEDNGDHRLFRIDRDADTVQTLLDAIDAFWACVCKDKAPPMDPGRDVFVPRGEQAETWRWQASEYRLLDGQLRALDSRLKLLKQQRDRAQQTLESMMGEFLKADYGGVTLTRFEKQGSIDYGKYLKGHHPEVSQADLEAYRRRSTTQTRVTLTDEAMPKDIVDPAILQTTPALEADSAESLFF